MSSSFINYPSAGPDVGIVKDLTPAAAAGTAADAAQGSLKRLYQRIDAHATTTVATGGENSHTVLVGVSASNGIDVGATYRNPHVAVNGMVRVRLRWQGNFNGVPNASPITMAAGLEIPLNGTNYLVPLSFNGQRYATLSPGGTLQTDWSEVYVPPGTKFWSRTYVGVPAGQTWPTGAVPDAVNYGGSDYGLVRNNYLGDAAYSGTCQAGSTASTIVFSAAASATDGFYNYCNVTITGGTGSGQTRQIGWYGQGYTGSTRTAGVTANWTTTPDATSQYAINQTYAGHAVAATSSSITLSLAANTTANAFPGQQITIVSGTGAGQMTTITAYNTTTRVATVSPAWTTTPDTTSVYQISLDYTTNAGFTPAALGLPAGASSNHTYYDNTFLPQAILGVPVVKGPVIGILGDSIGSGQNDGGGAGPGFFARWLGTATYPWVRATQPSESASVRADGNVFLQPQIMGPRLLALEGCTHVISQYGVNDLRGNATASQMMTGLLAVWQVLAARGHRAYQTTITPLTGSTDGWTSAGNQTAQNNSIGVLQVTNDWIRDGAPILSGAPVATGSSATGTLRAGNVGHPLVGYFEVSDAVCTSRNSGLWKSGYTNDGVHPNATAHAAILAGLGTPSFVLN